MSGASNVREKHSACGNCNSRQREGYSDITLENVLYDSVLQSGFLQYLSCHDKKGFARFLFLVSVDEFKKLLGQEGLKVGFKENGSSPGITRRPAVYACKIISKFMSKDSFLDIASENLKVFNKSVWSFGIFLKQELTKRSGISFTADFFQEVENVVKQALDPSLRRYKKTKQFKDLVDSLNIESGNSLELHRKLGKRDKLSRLSERVDGNTLSSRERIGSFHIGGAATSAARDVFLNLQKVLSNRRLCSIFWVQLYKEGIHQPLSLWMELWYQLIPALNQYKQLLSSDASDAKVEMMVLRERIVCMARNIVGKYMVIGASAQVHILGDSEQTTMQAFMSHARYFSEHEEMTASDIQKIHESISVLSKKLEYDLNVNHFIRFVSNSAVRSLMSSYQSRLLSPSGFLHDSAESDSDSIGPLRHNSEDPFTDCDTVSDTSMTTLQEIFHCMNVASHQPQQIRRRKFTVDELMHGSALSASDGSAISAIMSFYYDLKETKMQKNVLFSLGSNNAGTEYHHSIPEHVDVFFCPEGPSVICAKTRPLPRLFALTIGNLEKSFHAACLTRYVAVTNDTKMRPLEQVLHDEQGLELYVPVGICILSRFPILDTMRRRLDWMHLCLKDNESYLNDIHWSPKEEQMRELLAPFDCVQSALVPLKAQDYVDFSVDKLLDCLSIENIITLLSCMMLERQIVLISSQYSDLTSVGETLKCLLSPLMWSHIFAPILPRSMLDCLQCPTPYLFGAHTKYREELDQMLQCEGCGDEIVVVDMDSDKITGSNIRQLPEPMHARLSAKLKDFSFSWNAFGNSDTVSPSERVFYESREFARMRSAKAYELRSCISFIIKDMISALEEYRFVLSDDFDFVVVFDEKRYLHQLSARSREFYRSFLETQLFSHAIATVNVS